MSTGRSFTLDAWVCAQNDDDETQTRAAVRYDPANPWSVRLTVKHNDAVIIRHLSRDILREGFVAPIYPRFQRDDIIVRPDCNDYMVEIVIPTVIAGNPDRLYVRVAKVELAMVLEEILKMVPLGEEGERFDWAAGVEHCQADAA